MDIDTTRLKMLYGVLIGIEQALTRSGELFYKTLGDEYSVIVKDLASVLGQDLSLFELPESIYDHYNYVSALQARKEYLEAKLLPLISFLEQGYHPNQELVQIGSLYGSLEDEELRKRCADILLGQNSFDRAVSQATMVLEERIRRKAKDASSLTGTQLVNTYVKARPEESKVVFSSDPDE